MGKLWIEKLVIMNIWEWNKKKEKEEKGDASEGKRDAERGKKGHPFLPYATSPYPLDRENLHREKKSVPFSLFRRPFFPLSNSNISLSKTFSKRKSRNKEKYKTYH